MARRGTLLRSSLRAAVALFLLFVPAALALSQCDSSAFQDSHTGAWQGWGGVWSSIPGNPYTAIFHSRSEKKLPNGTLQVYEGDYKEARDSNGREYRDSTSGDMISGMHTFLRVSIFDPVCGLMIDWDTETKVATVTHLVPTQPVQGRWRPDIPASAQTEVRNGIERRIEPLGTKTILGLEAVGIRWSSIIPPDPASHNDQPVHVLTERWDSPALNIMLEHLMDDPRTSAGHTHMQLIHLDRSEPDPSLFHIPAGYTIENRWAPAQELGPEVAPGWK
jgi:hypothetical protein